MVQLAKETKEKENRNLRVRHETFKMYFVFLYFLTATVGILISRTCLRTG